VLLRRAYIGIGLLAGPAGREALEATDQRRQLAIADRQVVMRDSQGMQIRLLALQPLRIEVCPSAL
jgi:hypothetical protein